jgi:hypothetical protein
MRTVYIIADISATMAEMGKYALLRNVTRAAAQMPALEEHRFRGISLRFFLWSHRVDEFNGITGWPTEIYGKPDVPALKEALIWMTDGNADNSAVLLISDGAFDLGKSAEFNNIKRRAVSIGADAVIPTLVKFSGGAAVYGAADIRAAVGSLLAAAYVVPREWVG